MKDILTKLNIKEKNHGSCIGGQNWIKSEDSGVIKSINPSSTMALTAKANDMRQKGDNVIILTVGEPDFDTPNHIKEAAVSAINQGQTKYTAIDGTPNLKKAIIHKIQNENGLSYSPDQIIASVTHPMAEVETVVPEEEEEEFMDEGEEGGEEGSAPKEDSDASEDTGNSTKEE